MNCPRCSGSQLQRAMRQGVEVDFCTTCLGIWFDRGEVEKVFNRLSTVDPAEWPEQWEPVEPALAPALFADLLDLERR